MGAIGLAGHAAAAAVPDEEVAPEGPGVLGDNLYKIPFDFDGVFLFGEAEALAEAGDVGVDDDAGLDAVGVAQDDVGGFASDTGKIGQRFEIFRDLAAVLLRDGFGGSDEIFGFVAEEAGGADEVFDVFLLRGGESFGVGVFFKEGGRHHVDADVGALRGEDGGDEELEGARVVEFTMGVGIGLPEDFQNFGGGSGTPRPTRGGLAHEGPRALRRSWALGANSLSGNFSVSSL